MWSIHYIVIPSLWFTFLTLHVLWSLFDSITTSFLSSLFYPLTLTLGVFSFLCDFITSTLVCTPVTCHGPLTCCHRYLVRSPHDFYFHPAGLAFDVLSSLFDSVTTWFICTRNIDPCCFVFDVWFHHHICWFNPRDIAPWRVVIIIWFHHHMCYLYP